MKPATSLMFVGIPFVSGLVLILLALSRPIWSTHADRDYLCLSAGLICASIACACVLLAQIAVNGVPRK